MTKTIQTDQFSQTPAASARGWTPQRKALFLERLSVHANARAACRNVGLSAEAAYRLRRRDPLFARAWAAAVVLGRDNSVTALAERAVEGVEEPIYYRGELVGTRRRYDSRLLLAHLARLDAMADEPGARADAARFDELVALVAEDAAGDLPANRERFIAETARAAERDADLAFDDACADLFDDNGTYRPGINEAQEEALNNIRLEAIDRAADDAADAWDARVAGAIAIVDALIAAEDETRASPPAPTPAAQTRMAAELVAGIIPASGGKQHLAPCTLSTASTASLATALASARPFPPTPPSRSPFSAPRPIGAPA